MVQPSRDEIGKQRHAQPVGQAGGFGGPWPVRRWDTTRRSAGIPCSSGSRRPSTCARTCRRVAFAPGEAEVRADQIAHAAVDALVRIEHRHPAHARRGEVVPDAVAGRGQYAARRLGVVAPRGSVGIGQVAVGAADAFELSNSAAPARNARLFVATASGCLPANSSVSASKHLSRSRNGTEVHSVPSITAFGRDLFIAMPARRRG